MWDEALFCSGSKSREIITDHNHVATKVGLKVCNHIQPFISNHTRNRTTEATDVVVRGTDMSVYCEGITNYMCTYLYEKDPCEECRKPKKS